MWNIPLVVGIIAAIVAAYLIGRWWGSGETPEAGRLRVRIKILEAENLRLTSILAILENAEVIITGNDRFVLRFADTDIVFGPEGKFRSLNNVRK